MSSFQNQLADFRKAQAQRFRKERHPIKVPQRSTEEIGEDEVWTSIFSFVENDNIGFKNLLQWRLVCKRFYLLIEYRPEIWNKRCLRMNEANVVSSKKMISIVQMYHDMYCVKGFNLRNMIFEGVDFSNPDVNSSWLDYEEHLFGITFLHCVMSPILGQSKFLGDLQLIGCSLRELRSKEESQPTSSVLLNFANTSDTHHVAVETYPLCRRRDNVRPPAKRQKYSTKLEAQEYKIPPFPHVKRIVLDSGDHNSVLWTALYPFFLESACHLVIKGNVLAFLLESSREKRYVKYLTIHPPQTEEIDKEKYFHRMVRFPGVARVYQWDSDTFWTPHYPIRDRRGRIIAKEETVDSDCFLTSDASDKFIYEVDHSAAYQEEKAKQWEIITILRGYIHSLSPLKQEELRRMMLEKERLLHTKQYLGEYSTHRLQSNYQVLVDFAKNEGLNDSSSQTSRSIYLREMRNIVQKNTTLRTKFPDEKQTDHANLLRRITGLLETSQWGTVEKEVLKLKKENEEMEYQLSGSVTGGHPSGKAQKENA